MNERALIILGIIAVIVLYVFRKTANKGGRIPDDEINVDLIKGLLQSYKFKPSLIRKNGITEKDVQKDLFQYLKSKIENISREYNLESLSGDKIDFDIGNGKVGLDLKFANKVGIAKYRNGAIGQMVQYSKKKYKDGNFMFGLIGSIEEKETSAYKEFVKDVISHKGHVIFIETDEVAIEEQLT